MYLNMLETCMLKEKNKIKSLSYLKIENKQIWIDVYSVLINDLECIRIAPRNKVDITLAVFDVKLTKISFKLLENLINYDI